MRNRRMQLHFLDLPRPCRGLDGFSGHEDQSHRDVVDRSEWSTPESLGAEGPEGAPPRQVAVHCSLSELYKVFPPQKTILKLVNAFSL